MAADNERLEVILERIDEIIRLMKEMSDELRTVSASLKSLAVSQITHPVATPPPQLSRDISEKAKSLEDVRRSFPEDLEPLVNIEDKGDYIMIKPRQFLGSENFAKIASAVRNMGGEYISLGKDSHFRVPKKKS